MSKPDETPEEQAATAMLRSAATTLAATALARHLPPEAAMIVATGAGTLLPAYGVAIFDRARSRVRCFVDEFRAAAGLLPDRSVTEGDDGTEVLEALNTPETRDATLDALRAVLDAVDEAAIPCIARLMREYTSKSAKPDRFYRGGVRMLATCDADDLADLRAVLSKGPQMLTAGAIEMVATRDTDEEVRFVARVGKEGGAILAEIRVRSSSRVLNLLINHGFARQTDAAACAISPETIGALLRVLGRDVVSETNPTD